jgi:signal transduction histidine kinase
LIQYFLEIALRKISGGAALTDNQCNLKQTNKDQSEDFFRNINIQFLIHELKGPVNVIETNIRMLLELQKDFGHLTAAQQQILKRSMRSTFKLRDIIHSILEVGSSQSGRIDLQQFDVVQCATEVLVHALETVDCVAAADPEAETDPVGYLAANGIALDVSPEVQGVCLRQDKTKFMYILGNLARNGLHYKNAQMAVQMALMADSLQIIVSDDGPGIKPKDHKNLFKCYNQKRSKRAVVRKGHGLGLASSRILARYLGGDITIDSQCSEGARFVLLLPLILDDQSAREDGYDVHVVDDITST